MRVRSRASAIFLCVCVLACRRGTSGGDLRFAQLGECKVQSGEVIRDCRIGYRTFGELNEARDNQRSIIQRRSAAMAHRETQTRIRKVDTSEAFAKFETYENHIDRIEAEADLVDSLRPKPKESLREQFSSLEREEEIERELAELKRRMGPSVQA